MNRRQGQAGRVLGWVWRGFAMLFLTVFGLAALGLGVLAWRLDQGPLQIPYVASRLATALSGQGVRVRIGQAALAWAGYKSGGGAPLYLRLQGITASNEGGAVLATVPSARLLFPVRAVFGLAAPVDVAGQGARLAESDAAVGVAALLHFGFGFALRGADVTVTVGPGTVGPAGGAVAITGGGFLAHLAGPDAVLENGTVSLRPSGGSAPVLRFSGVAHRAQDWRGTLSLTADAVRVADLPEYWPPPLGRNAREWVIRNITAGTASNGSLRLVLSAPGTLSNFTLQELTGGFDGTALTLRWLPAAPPITGLDGHLTVEDADTILVTESAARLGKLALRDGTMRITGIDHDDQTGIVRLRAVGQLGDAIAVLNAPPLSLLAQAPAELARATGDVTVDVAATLPLENRLKLAQVKLAVTARLTEVTVPTPIAGLSFTGGTLVLTADQRQLSVVGGGLIAGQRTTLTALNLYGQNPALRHFQLCTVLGGAALNSLGLDNATAATDAVSGTVPLTLRLDAGPGGGEDVTADADITAAKLGVPALGWAKRVGQPGAVHAAAVIDAAGTVMVRAVTARGPDLAIVGTLRGRDLHLAPLLIGRTSAAGDVVFPARPAEPYVVDLAGASLDLRAILNKPKPAVPPARQPPGSAAAGGPAWRARLRFATLFLGRPPAPPLRDLVVAGAGAGEEVSTMDATAVTQAGQPVSLIIGPAAVPPRRDLTLASGDGGALLRVLDAYDDLQGGALKLGASYGGGAPFAGTVTLTKFQLLRAPAFAKVLQGLTIYGVPEATAGPGLVFSRLVAPFSIAHETLTLVDARAYSASLGFTASGTIGLDDGATDLNATVIPAYALNALPGKIPLIGKIFTAEKGGGLFSVRVRITGLLASPKVSVNPLSVLTPGALRGVFGAAKK